MEKEHDCRRAMNTVVTSGVLGYR